MNKLFLEGLPRLGKTNKIDWKNCIGIKVRFVYNGIEGYLQITSYDNSERKQILILKYKDIDGFKIRTPHFIDCKLGFVVNNIVTNEESQWMIKYFQGGYDEAKKYTYSSNQKIKPVCPECGRVKDKEISIKNIYKNKSIGCSCSDGKSYPEKFMNQVLDQLNIKFITEYSPDWIKPRRYDFYFKLNDKEYIVEMDGYFHNNDNLMNGQTMEESNNIDKDKNIIAKIHDIEVIRVDSDYKDNDRFSYIKSHILKSKLTELFDLSLVDFDKCDKYACSNLIKEACNLKRNNPNITTTIIGRTMGYSRVTIKNWLIQGNKNRWCEYNTEEEILKSIKNNGINNGKKVEIFKNNISLGVFPSCSELERQSEELFGVKLNYKNISAVCIGKRKQHKDFTFSYV